MPDAHIIGILTTAHTSLHASLQGLQNDAWREEISLLKDILTPYIGRGHIYFEYTIPRMGRRIDVVLLIDGVVLLLEFKAFNEQYTKADIAQVWDYALDLKTSTSRAIIARLCRYWLRPRRLMPPQILFHLTTRFSIQY